MALSYWILDSSIHWLIYKEDLELIPDDLNELWMRSLIVIIVFIFGFYAEIKTRQLVEKEKEKQRVFKATVVSTQHILNNLLNQLLYIKTKLEEEGKLDHETSQQMSNIIQKGTLQVLSLSEVKDISADAIKQSVYPTEST